MLLCTDDFVAASALGKRAFTYIAPRCWNALPIDICLISSLDHFKGKLKSYLFTDFRRFLRNMNPYTSVGLLNGVEHADDLFLLNYIIS